MSEPSTELLGVGAETEVAAETESDVEVQNDQEPEDKKRYICLEPGCGRTFETAQGLTMHQTRAHKRQGRRGSRRRTAAPEGSEPTLNRDALLRTVFPNGVPTRADLLPRIAAWLAEAEAFQKVK